ncbi:MAG TPA: NUDIX hydrolase [bacterium]|nr:NUDIX hydrolase [bacterium]
MDEAIFVVPRRALLPAPVHGFTTAGAAGYLRRIRRHGFFRRRGDVEQDPSLKQIIPYLVVRHRDRLFLVRRTAAGGEARLHGKVSIGVGGHINRADVAGADDVVAAALRRELAEELVIEAPWQARYVGVLNDDTNPVGQVHFGLVHIVEVAAPAISVRETDTLTGELAAAAEVRARYGQMETWSQLILDAADPLRL